MIKPQQLVRDGLAAVRILRAFLPYVRPHRRRVAFQFAFALLSAMAGATTPLLAKFVLDNILAAKNVHLFALFIAAYLASFFGMQALKLLQQHVSMVVNSSIDFKLRLSCIHSSASSPHEAIRQRSTGEQVYSLGSDIGAVNGMIATLFSDCASNLIMLGTAFFAMLKIDWRVALPVVLMVPVVLIARLLTATVLKKQAERIRAVDQHITGSMYEMLAMLPVAQMAGRERDLIRTYSRQAKDRLRLSFAQWRTQTWLGQLQWLLETAPGTMVTCWIWFGVLRGEKTLGSAVAFTMYANMILPPFVFLVDLYRRLVIGSVAGQRLREALCQEREGGRSLPDMPRLSAPPSLRLENVSFGYTDGHPILRNLTLHVPAGGLTILQGPSGAGKSTIFKLICRLYRPSEGNIYLGGHSLSEVNPRSLRRQIGFMSHESVLFTGTVRQNLAFGNAGVSDADLANAADLALATDFIERLPQGWDTVIHREHPALSAGQKQRLLLARAIASPHWILLLDEPFANVDPHTQEALWGTLELLSARRTIMVVTHSLLPTTRLRCKRVFLDALGRTHNDSTDVNRMVLQTAGIRETLP